MRVLAFFAGLTAVAADDLAAELRMLTSNASNATTAANKTNATDAITISSGATMQTPITLPTGITGDAFAKLLCAESQMKAACLTFATTAAAKASSKITAKMVGNIACAAGTRRARELAAAASGFKLKVTFDIVVPKADMVSVLGSSDGAAAMAAAAKIGSALDTVLTGYKTNGLPAALQTGFKTALKAALNSSTFIAALTAAGVTDVATWQAAAIKAADTDWTVTSIVSASVKGSGSFKGAKAAAATAGAATQAIAAVFMMVSSVMLF